MNRDQVGKEYPPSVYRVEAAATVRYARACNETHPRFLDPDAAGGLIAPPIFGVVIAARAIASAVGDRDLGIDFPRALHGEQDMEFLRPIRPGEEVSTTARVEAIEAKPTGETLVVALALRDPGGEVVQRQRFVLFVRARGAAKRASPTLRGQPPPRDAPYRRISQRLDRDQTFRYAEASGDRTPIHLDETVARKAGLGGIIAHGLCTMAFAARAAIEATCDGDPTRLARLAVRFARTVRPGQTLTHRFWEAEARAGRRIYDLETRNPDGAPVLSAGVCEVWSRTH
ncbi:MAG: MaoC/PaaZ C-terminal domain-containing protein [Myxococcota bacterium]